MAAHDTKVRAETTLHRARRTPARRRQLRLEWLEQRCVLASSLFGVPIGQGNVIVELNPQTGVEIRRINSPVPISGGPDGLAYNGESLFLLNGSNTLFEINPLTGVLIDSDSLAGMGSGSFDGLGFLNGKVYIQDYSANQIHVFDPVSDIAGSSLNVSGATLTGGITAATAPDELIGTQTADVGVRINPATGAVLGTFSLGSEDYLGVAAVNNQLFFGSTTANQIRVTDRAGVLVTTLTTPYRFSALASDDTRIERITNGGFEQHLNGWTIFTQPGSGGGQFNTYTGSNPQGSPLPAPPQGQRAAFNDHVGAGTRILYRDLVLPAGQTHTLSLIAYDATALEISAVRLGSLLKDSGWIIASRNDSLAGRIIISLGGMTSLEGVFQGELVQLQARVKETARPGEVAINLAASSRDPSRFTQLNEGYLTLIPAPTDAANDAIDGVLTILPNGASANAAETPAARLVNDQLLITGTSASDYILVGAWSDGLVRVRVGNRLLGTFATPRGLAIDGLDSSDIVIAAANLPATLIATSQATSDRDWIFATNDARVMTITSERLSDRELALLQLLAEITAEEPTAARQNGSPRNTSLRRR